MEQNDPFNRSPNTGVQARAKAQNRANVMQLKLIGQSHPTGLTTNLLKLFEPRPPLEFKPPPEKRKCPSYTGMGQFVTKFAQPGDPEYAPPVQEAEIPALRKARIHKIRLEEGAKKAAEEFEKYDPNNDHNIAGDPYKTLFVARLNYETTESRLKRELETYGPIKRVRLVTNKNTNKPRGYAFIEYVHTRDMKSAYKQADGKKIDNRRVLVDVERGRTVPNWRPRRLGGGLGTSRAGGEEVNLKTTGREQPQSGGAARSEEPRIRDDRDREREKSRERVRDRDGDREKSRDRGRDREGDREKSRERVKDREIDREKSRERVKDREIDREKSRERSQDVERDREHRDDKHHRDREKTRDKGEREKDRGGRDRDRERNRDRDRGRDRGRDHDRDRRGRDRDRDRHREKDKDREHDIDDGEHERGRSRDRETDYDKVDVKNERDRHGDREKYDGMDEDFNHENKHPDGEDHHGGYDYYKSYKSKGHNGKQQDVDDADDRYKDSDRYHDQYDRMDEDDYDPAAPVSNEERDHRRSADRSRSRDYE